MILATHGIVADSISSSSLLLDMYSGAVGAYSLRKLRTAYTGHAIRVRRSSDNTSQDIGFVNNTLDTTSLTSFVGAGNGFISIWYDQSGNSNNIQQTTLTSQPQIIYSGVISIVNSKPTINFGSASTSYYFEFPSGFINNYNSLSYFQTSRLFLASNSGVFGPSTSNSVGLEVLQVNVLSRPSYLRINNILKNDNTASNYQLWNNGTQTLFSIHADSTSTTAQKNNSNVSLTNSSGISALNFNGVYALGRYATTQYMDGDIQELIIYPNNQNSNSNNINTNINSFYSIY